MFLIPIEKKVQKSWLMNLLFIVVNILNVIQLSLLAKQSSVVTFLSDSLQTTQPSLEFSRRLKSAVCLHTCIQFNIIWIKLFSIICSWKKDLHEVTRRRFFSPEVNTPLFKLNKTNQKWQSVRFSFVSASSVFHISVLCVTYDNTKELLYGNKFNHALFLTLLEYIGILALDLFVFQWQILYLNYSTTDTLNVHYVISGKTFYDTNRCTLGEIYKKSRVILHKHPLFCQSIYLLSTFFFFFYHSWPIKKVTAVMSTKRFIWINFVSHSSVLCVNSEHFWVMFHLS